MGKKKGNLNVNKSQNIKPQKSKNYRPKKAKSFTQSNSNIPTLNSLTKKAINQVKINEREAINSLKNSYREVRKKEAELHRKEKQQKREEWIKGGARTWRDVKQDLIEEGYPIEFLRELKNRGNTWIEIEQNLHAALESNTSTNTAEPITKTSTIDLSNLKLKSGFDEFEGNSTSQKIDEALSSYNIKPEFRSKYGIALSKEEADLYSADILSQILVNPDLALEQRYGEHYTKIRARLLAEGYTQEQIDYWRKEEGMTYAQVEQYLLEEKFNSYSQDELKIDTTTGEIIYPDSPNYNSTTSINFEEAYSNDDTITSLKNYEPTDYYLDPDTGEIFSPDDPRIFVKRHGRTVRGEVKKRLEHHTAENLTADAIELLKKSNFLGEYKNARGIENDPLNPLPIFEEIINDIGTSDFFEILAELSDYSSNITDVEYWYNASEAAKAEKLSSIISAAEQITGNDYSHLQEQIQEVIDNLEDSEDYAGDFGEVRQQNRYRR